ncbi:pyrimidine-nucleoside phosphorylase [Thermoanaerobacterium sp. DL9XJH110]|uniref:pyrimidine-nucleoside phosphorylase n=1 Tax=Thermoanaerobacterium sp. DL9XJH110 TaxID=3386643 RepID=UPI003BB7CA35
MLFMPDIIEKKKRGHKLSQEEIQFVVSGYVKGDIPDYQVSALLMAVYFRGLDEEETTHLTMAMAGSGEMVDLSGIDGIKVDKHSSGGIADTTTLVLIPLVASAGVRVAKMSGRGLGHTGGTIDKLESIPGFRTELSAEEFTRSVNRVGAAITGQSRNLVPADKKLYALRDVTATVDSIPLIASSIMSKKIAGGADKIVLDVKYGSGAFMKEYEGALELGKLMVKIGNLAGRETVAFITDMDQPLGTAVGNAIEVMEAAETLKGRGHRDLVCLCLELGSEMMCLAGVEKDRQRAKKMLEDNIKNGKAMEKFRQIVLNQGGDPAALDDYSLLPGARFRQEVAADKSGYVKRIDAMRIGLAAMKLGAGRQKKDDVINPGVGVWIYAKVGDRIEKGEPFARVLADDQERLKWAVDEVAQAYEFSEQEVEKRKVIRARITRDGIREF